jgi:hypothetical protein
MFSITIKGTYSTTGVTCSDQWITRKIAASLKAGATSTFTCGSNTWRTSNSCGTELAVNTSVCQCGQSYSVRPNITNYNWGGANTITCNWSNTAVTQRMIVDIATSIAPLPVNLYNFTAEIQKFQVKLNWESANEDEASYFKIMHSSDGIEWKSINEIKALNNDLPINSYTYMHTTPSVMNYYKIVAVDKNDIKTYSQILRINFEEKRSSNILYLFPNPSNGQVTFNVAESSVYTLTDASGRVVKTGSAHGETVLSDLAVGVYALSVNNSNHVETIQIIVK